MGRRPAPAKADADTEGEEDENLGSFSDFVAAQMDEATQRIQTEYRRLHGQCQAAARPPVKSWTSSCSSSTGHLQPPPRLESAQTLQCLTPMLEVPARGGRDLRRASSAFVGDLKSCSAVRPARDLRRESLVMFGDLGVPPPLPVGTQKALAPSTEMRRNSLKMLEDLGASTSMQLAQAAPTPGVRPGGGRRGSRQHSVVMLADPKGSSSSLVSPGRNSKPEEQPPPGRRSTMMPDDIAIAQLHKNRTTEEGLRLEQFVLPEARQSKRCSSYNAGSGIRSALWSRANLRSSNRSTASVRSQNNGNNNLTDGLNTCCSEEWTFYPNSLFYRTWSYAISALVIANCFFTPLQFAFVEEIPSMEAFDTFTDVFFAIDILLTFNVAFVTKTQLHISRRDIFYHYLCSTRLWIALTATIPFDSIYYLIAHKDKNKHIRAAIGLLRLLRINRLIFLFHDFQKNTSFNLLGVVVAKFVLFILLCTHTSGCFFYALARINNFDENTWVPKVDPNLPLARLSTRYVHVLFWAVGTFKAGPSHSSITPTSNSEMVLAVVSMLVNICLQTYLVSNMAALLTSSDVRIYSFRKEVNELNEFSSRYSLPKELSDQVKAFLSFKFMTNQEVDQTMLKRLPELYRQRISHVLYEEVMASVELFTGCQQLFLLQLHSSLTTTLYMPAQCLANVDEPCTSLQILSEGMVELFCRGNSVDFCEVGESFSAVPFLCKVGHRFMVRTCLFTRLLSLDHESWDHACSGYPENLNQVKVNLLEYCQFKSSMFDDDTPGQLVYKELHSIVETNLVQQREMGIAMMCSAAARGDINELKRLLVGLSPDCANCDGRTPLHVAASCGEMEAIRILIEKTAEVNPVDSFGRTPLMDACQAHQRDAAKELFQHGAVLGLSNRKSSKLVHTPTMKCPTEGSSQTEGAWSSVDNEASELCKAAATIDKLWYLKTLLRYRANPNHTDYDLRTPLHVACATGNTFAVNVLARSSGTDLSRLDQFGQSPLIEAVRRGHEECAAILKAHDASHGYLLDAKDRQSPLEILAGQELCNAASSNQVPLLQRLISYCGLEADVPGEDSRTALMAACAAGNTDAAVFLVRSGADMNLMDCFGNTPIKEAQRHDHTDLLDVLRCVQAEVAELRTFSCDAAAPVEGAKCASDLRAAGAHAEEVERVSNL